MVMSMEEFTFTYEVEVRAAKESYNTDEYDEFTDKVVVYSETENDAESCAIWELSEKYSDLGYSDVKTNIISVQVSS